MHTVVETPAYLASAKRDGMTEAEMIATVNLVAGNPLAGDLIVGSGGCRKVRVAGRGKGKSGGYRVVTYYVHEGAPVFLLAALSKGSEANFSAAQIAVMKQATASMAADAGAKAGASDKRR
jgi:hypothetical protein